MSDQEAKNVTDSFSYPQSYKNFIRGLALELTAVRGRIVHHSEALRHVIDVYQRLPESIRRAEMVREDDGGEG